VNTAVPTSRYVVVAFILAGFLFALAGCSEPRSAPATQATPSSLRVEFADTPDMDPYYAVDSLSEVQAKAAAVVRVRMLEHTPLLEPDRQRPVTGPPLGYTVSPVLVENVYKSDGTIQEGDHTKIIEYYVTWQDHSTGAVRVESSATVPMVVGAEYILFLHKTSDPGGQYNFFGDVYGKYRVSEKIKAATSVDSLTREDLEVPWNKDVEPGFWKLAAEVKQKYIDPEQ
jgi:hypothetical protein